MLYILQWTTGACYLLCFLCYTGYTCIIYIQCICHREQMRCPCDWIFEFCGSTESMKKNCCLMSINLMKPQYCPFILDVLVTGCKWILLFTVCFRWWTTSWSRSAAGREWCYLIRLMLTTYTWMVTSYFGSLPCPTGVIHLQ